MFVSTLTASQAVAFARLRRHGEGGTRGDTYRRLQFKMSRKGPLSACFAIHPSSSPLVSSSRVRFSHFVGSTSLCAQTLTASWSFQPWTPLALLGFHLYVRRSSHGFRAHQPRQRPQPRLRLHLPHSRPNRRLSLLGHPLIPLGHPLSPPGHPLILHLTLLGRRDPVTDQPRPRLRLHPPRSRRNRPLFLPGHPLIPRLALLGRRGPVVHQPRESPQSRLRLRPPPSLPDHLLSPLGRLPTPHLARLGRSGPVGSNLETKMRSGPWTQSAPPRRRSTSLSSLIQLSDWCQTRSTTMRSPTLAP